MERDPVRFVWRSAPGLNVALIVLAVVGIPCLWTGLDLVRAAIDDAAFGRAFQDGRQTAPFMRFALALPERILDEALVLIPGAQLTREAFVSAAVLALAAAAIAAGLFAFGLKLLMSAVGHRAVDDLGTRILSGIASAPVSASEAAQRSATIASDALVGQRPFLGRAIGMPAVGAAMLLGSLAYAAAQDVRLCAIAVIGLAALGFASRGREAASRRLASAEGIADGSLRQEIVELARHLSALASHGTAAAEQARISAELAPVRAPARAAERTAIAMSAVTTATTLAPALVVLGAGAWLASMLRISPGEAVAGAFAAGIATAALDGLMRWRRDLALTQPIFAEIARQLGMFKARRRDAPAAPLPASGSLAAEGLLTDGSLQGGRLAGLDLAIELPSHVAILGDAGSGARSYAGLLGGQVASRAGRVTFGGVDVTESDPVDRARRLAFAGGDTFLLAGSLRTNMLYGCPDTDAHDIEARLMAAVRTGGLAGFVYRRGLAGTIDARRAPKLAAEIVGARRAVRAALDQAGLSDRVQTFEPDSYNPQATIGENILFGVPVGDTFRDENLPSHAFMRNLLDREQLTQPLAEFGASIVRSTIEMFWDLQSRTSIIGRFSLLTRTERDEFELLLNRQSTQPRGAASRDQARLIGLALRYSESRHRMGLLEPGLEERILRVRAGFEKDLPKGLESTVEFFRPDRICASTSVLDNLLFGRIAQDRADASSDVFPVLKRVLRELDLTGEVIRIGLEARIDPVANALVASKLAAIDLVRCLMRQPDNLVVQRALDDLAEPAASRLVERLTSEFAGRGLIVVLPQQAMGCASRFDRVVTFESGRAAAADGAPAAARMRGPKLLSPDVASPEVLSRDEPVDDEPPWLYGPGRAGLSE